MNTPWIKDIRRVALLAFVVSLASWLAFFWRLISLSRGSLIWTPGIILIHLMSLIVSAFFFALYRNEELIGLPDNLRWLSLGAAVMNGLVGAFGFPRWVQSFEPFIARIQMGSPRAGASPVLAVIQDPEFSSVLSNLISEIAMISCVLLLIAFFEQTMKESNSRLRTSRLLSVTTYVMLIALGVELVVSISRASLIISNKVIWIGLVTRQVCLWTVPFVVWRGWLSGTNRRESNNEKVSAASRTPS